MSDDPAAGTDAGAASPGAAAPGRCPQCGARRDDGISWCSQCYADLTTDEHAAGPPPAPDPVPADPVPADPVPADRVQLDRAELDRVSEAMLAQLAARPPAARGSSLVERALDGRLATTVTVTVGTLLVAVAGMALLYLVGAFL